MTEAITLAAAFLGGLGSFFLPCILPLLPAYITYLSGTSLTELEKRRSRTLQMRVFINAVFFVLGFSLIFILLGLLLGTLGAVPASRIWLGRIGGAIIIAFGLHTIGLLNIPFLNAGRRLRVKTPGPGYLGSSLMGISFGTGWTPCFTPILTSILVLAAAEGASATAGAGLLAAYALGLAVPFLITGAFTSKIAHWINRANVYFGIINVIAGVLLIGLGILIFTSTFERLVGLIVFGAF